MPDKKLDDSLSDVSYSLTHVGLDYFRIENPRIILEKTGIDVLKLRKEDPIEVNLKMGERLSWKRNVLQVFSQVTLSLNNQDKNEELGSFEFGFDFTFSSFTSLTKNNSITIPKRLVFTFYSICYSTIRGILWSKLNDTYLRTFIMPLVDINSLAKEDRVFSIEEKEVNAREEI